MQHDLHLHDGNAISTMYTTARSYLCCTNSFVFSVEQSCTLETRASFNIDIGALAANVQDLNDIAADIRILLVINGNSRFTVYALSRR